MAYNIHPIIVHFPIALLFVYSLLKIIPLKRWFPTVSWKQIERAFLLVGTLGAFMALSTGEVAEHLVRPNHDLVESHSFFAALATWVFAALLAGEAAAIARKSRVFEKWPSALLRIVSVLDSVFSNRALSIVLAVVGLVAISIAGLLGGVMVYGLTADPITPMVLRILGITL